MLLANIVFLDISVFYFSTLGPANVARCRRVLACSFASALAWRAGPSPCCVGVVAQVGYSFLEFMQARLSDPRILIIPLKRQVITRFWFTEPAGEPPHYCSSTAGLVSKKAAACALFCTMGTPIHSLMADESLDATTRAVEKAAQERQDA